MLKFVLKEQAMIKKPEQLNKIMSYYLNGMTSSQKGFTLIEALLAITITGIIYLVSMPPFIKLYDYMKLNQAISTFQSDLYFVRESNMLDDPLTLRIYHKQNYYVILQNGTKIILNRQLPTGVTIPANLNITDIRFNSLGHTTSGRTLTMQSEQFKKNIVFSIGIGGIDIRDAN